MAQTDVAKWLAGQVQGTGEAAAALVAAGARRVTARRDKFTAALVALYAAEIAPLPQDDQLVGLMAASTEQNVVALLHVLEHGLKVQNLDAPVAAVQYARRIAQRGIPLAAALRAYRLGQSAFIELMLQELATLPDTDPAAVAQATIEVLLVVSAYIDRISEATVTAYETEREAWSRHHWTVRATRVRSLLEGNPTEVRAAEAGLGYRLAATHVTALVWLDDQMLDEGDELLRLEQLAATTAARVGAQHLFAPGDGGSATVWFSVRGPTLCAADLSAALSAALVEAGQGAVRAAVGNPGEGVAGFRRSHRQAAQARKVMLVAPAGNPAVVAFAEVGAIALLCGDLDSTRTWVIDTLGGLAADDEDAARLRDTARIFLGVRSSFTAAAELLSMHKNTVQYRIRKAEELRGRSLREDRADVEFALRACHLLGAAVLDQPAR